MWLLKVNVWRGCCKGPIQLQDVELPGPTVPFLVRQLPHALIPSTKPSVGPAQQVCILGLSAKPGPEKYVRQEPFGLFVVLRAFGVREGFNEGGVRHEH